MALLQCVTAVSVDLTDTFGPWRQDANTYSAASLIFAPTPVCLCPRVTFVACATAMPVGSTHRWPVQEHGWDLDEAVGERSQQHDARTKHHVACRLHAGAGEKRLCARQLWPRWPRGEPIFIFQEQTTG